jgi:1-deoxy-D-xylulose-5-phosphate reductoisomerase
MIRLAILGSTGSIGQQTLDIVRSFPEKFKVLGLAGGRNAGLLAEQIRQFQPQLVYSATKCNLPHKLEFTSMEEMVSHPQVDLVVIATTGKAGLAPAFAAIKAGKKIALANKEILAMAGEIITTEARKLRVRILPIDSEHSAIWQCLRGERTGLSRIILTASGGPFYHYSSSQLAEVTMEEALKHPTWKMGKKVTIDSATLMNKGLEAIEAHWLFSVPFHKIGIVIHPQSIVHSLVEFVDGSTKAQLSFPDMHLPIQYALSYPKRLPNPKLPRLNLSQVHSLTFAPVNYHNFPCLQLALEAGRKGGTYPAVLCAADEIAIELFLSKHISFPDIAEIISKTIGQHQSITNPTLEDILAADAWARDTALKVANEENICYKQ